MAGGTRLDLLTSVEELAAVERDWRALAEELGNAFVTPEWYHASLRHYGEGAQPFVPVVRERDGRLRGLLPLVIHARGRLRTVRFGGANVGDHFQPVARGDDDVMVSVAAARALADERRRWAIVVLDNVTSAPWLQSLLASCPRRLAPVDEGSRVLPYADLPDGFDAYMATRKGHFRANLRRRQRQLEAAHTVRFRRTEHESELAADLERFFELHTRRWDARGGSIALSERARAFHHDFARAALEAGWLRLWSLEADGETIATWYGWRLGPRYAYYLGGFDTAWSRYGIGLLLVARTIRDACDEGCSVYDMLLGDEPWKESFETGRRSVRTVLATPARHPARLVTAAEVGLRRTARRLPDDTRERVVRGAVSVLRRLPGGRVR